MADEFGFRSQCSVQNGINLNFECWTHYFPEKPFSGSAFDSWVWSWSHDLMDHMVEKHPSVIGYCGSETQWWGSYFKFKLLKKGLTRILVSTVASRDKVSKFESNSGYHPCSLLVPGRRPTVQTRSLLGVRQIGNSKLALNVKLSLFVYFPCYELAPCLSWRQLG